MGLAYRFLIIDQNDHIYRLGAAKFDAMLRDPPKHRYCVFAGQRVRAACAVVELIDRKPTQIVRMTFDILTFDQAGYFDAETFHNHQFSRFEVGVMPVLRSLTPEAETEAGVVDASRRFLANGGTWTPAQALAGAISDAALDRIKCTRL